MEHAIVARHPREEGEERNAESDGPAHGGPPRPEAGDKPRGGGRRHDQEGRLEIDAGGGGQPQPGPVRHRVAAPVAPDQEPDDHAGDGEDPPVIERDHGQPGDRRVERGEPSREQPRALSEQEPAGGVEQ